MKKIYIWFSLLLFISTVSLGQTATIGSGTGSTTSSGSDPIDGYYGSFRYQVVYTAAELTSAGMPANSSISALGFSISGDYGGGNLLGYTIKMGHTAAANSASHDASVTTTVKNAFSYNPVVTAAGVFDMIAFDANFIWNGTDNILVDICSSGPNPFTSPYGQVRIIAASTPNGSRFIRSDSGSQCGVNTNTINTTKPNISFTYSGAAPCSGAPTGVMASGPANACAATAFNLVCTTTSTGTGITYQWQSSPASAGTFSDILGATTATYSVTQSVATDYRVIVTCSGSPTTSNIVAVAQNSFLNCYCVPPSSSCLGDNIASVVVGTLSDLGLTCTPQYEDRTSAQNAIPDFGQLSSTSMSVGVGNGGTEYVGVWIDYDHSGTFDASEYTALGSGNNAIVTGSISVPGTAMLGNTKMRVRTQYGSALAGADACLSVSFGSTRDYVINIIAPSTDAMDYVNLQFPATASIVTGGSAAVFTQGYEPGVTPPAGAGAGITVWIGVNATDTDPATWSGGAWTAATFNVQSGNNDEFQAAIGSSLASGTYYYASRWQLNTGPYVYGGYNVGGGGFWNGTSNISGVLTVTAPLGADCSNPILVSSYPYTSSTTTCGSGNDYGAQCSGFYGGGEDLVYQLDIPAAGTYQISVTATGSGSYIGWFLKDGANCANGSSCLANATSESGTLASSLYTFAASGTYFLIIDTWPSPDCSAFDISITTIACGAPIASVATLINSTTANANWTPTTGEFIIEYGPTSTFGTPGIDDMAGNVNNTVVTASNVGTKQLTGLTATTGYSYVVRLDCTGSANGYSLNSSTITFTTLAAPPANDEATSATAVSLGVGCTGAIYTNLNATPTSATPTEPENGGGAAFRTVWFTFIAPTSGAVRVSTDVGSGNVMTDSRVAIYSATNPADYNTFSVISSDDDGGSVKGLMSVVFATGLTPGATYYVQVGGSSSGSTQGSFCMTIDELNSSMLALSATCSSTPQTSFGTNPAYTGWVPILDASSKLIALLRNPTGASPNTYTNLDQNINTGAVRTDDAGKKYLDRNYSFGNSNAAIYDMQLFFLTSERDALALVDPSAATLTNLNVTRDPGVGCKNFPTGTDNTLLIQDNSGSVGGVDWVQVSTPGFSGFFINTGTLPLPVNILSFDAKSLNNKTVQLTWNVAAEVDVKEYTVERSNDNRNWSAIGSVKASQKSIYGFNDNSPVSGVNYYRLAVKDVNAAVAFSDIRTVNFSGKGNMALYPNPANNTLYVSGTDDKNVVVSIYNEVGQIVNTLSSNGETIRTGGIDVSQLLPGAYSIQVKGESGLTTMRFVKQ